MGGNPEYPRLDPPTFKMLRHQISIESTSFRGVTVTFPVILRDFVPTYLASSIVQSPIPRCNVLHILPTTLYIIVIAITSSAKISYP